jgi:glycosyltransferase involved in cell wall biosynthesis
VKISVVIPNYNHGEFVGTAVQSALNQTVAPHEVIVVDDGSTDGSREVLRDFGNNIRLICQDNRGLGGARNSGIQAATSDWIGLLDADDEWRPGFLEEMADLVASHPDTAVSYCCAQAMDSTGKDLPQVFGGPVVPPEDFYWTLLRTSFLIPSCVMLRRSAVMEEGLFRTIFPGCEDFDLWLRMGLRHRFVGTPKPLVRYRQHSRTFSANRHEMQRTVESVISKAFGPDDGVYGDWSNTKRRAYGGLYRYQALSFLRQNDSAEAIAQFRRALAVDPTLALDVDFFYDMALGSQPSGYRGSPQRLDLEKNIEILERLLDAVFGLNLFPELQSFRRESLGSANLAIGLVAYNSGRSALSRKYLIRALRYRPALWRSRLAVGNLLKSLIGRSALQALRGFKEHAVKRQKGLPGRQSIATRFQAVRHSIKYALWFLNGVGGRPVSLKTHQSVTILVTYFHPVRMRHINSQLRNILKCKFVEKIIVVNNNPTIRLETKVKTNRDRLVFVDKGERHGCGYRWVVASEFSSEYFIVIDDDLLLFPSQIALLFKRLVSEPGIPHGLAGLLRKGNGAWEYHEQKEMRVDFLCEVYAVTREHLMRYLELANRLSLAPVLGRMIEYDADCIVISSSSADLPHIHDAGRIFRCLSFKQTSVAVHRRPGFRQSLLQVSCALENRRRDAGNNPSVTRSTNGEAGTIDCHACQK